MRLVASSIFQNHLLAGKSSIFKNSQVTPISARTTTNIYLVGVLMDGDGGINGKNTKKRKAKQQKRKTTTIVRCSNNNRNGEEIVRDMEDFGSDETLKIRASLLEWYDQHKRDLPWRRIVNEEKGDDDDEDEFVNRKAYAVWVSEVMLQQTQVVTVIDYYNRWMNKWPSLQHLAQASLEEVNEMWAGLGYYRRARYLLEGAKMIVEGGGSFPRTIDALRKVPGIGDYTAGAIGSIALKEAVPVVDGNVIRVIARLKAFSSNPKGSLAVKNFWRLAGQLVDPSRPGDFNQALMELGATICSPLNPSCSACPISGQCSALSESKRCMSVKVTDYPMKVVKTKQRHEFAAVCVVEILEGQEILEGNLPHNGLFLIIKRPDEGLLAGLWEFPSVLVDGEADLTARRKAIDNFLKKSFKLEPEKTCTIVLREHVGEYVHIFSHIRLKMHVEYLVLNQQGGMELLSRNQDKETIGWKCVDDKVLGWKCVDDKVLSGMGLTSGVRKVYTMIQKFKQISSSSTPNHAKRRKEKTKKRNIQRLKCS